VSNAYVGKAYKSVQEIIDAARAVPHAKLCTIEGCACRKLFPPQS
jgi:hypothetical protein